MKSFDYRERSVKLGLENSNLIMAIAKALVGKTEKEMMEIIGLAKIKFTVRSVDADGKLGTPGSGLCVTVFNGKVVKTELDWRVFE
jgi:hypothetical protein